MVENFEKKNEKDAVVYIGTSGSKKEDYSSQHVNLQQAHDINEGCVILNPEDFYDNIPQIHSQDFEIKEHYEPLKVYEVKKANIENVFLGKKSLNVEKYTSSFVVNGPLYNSDGIPVGGYIYRGKQIKNFIDPDSLPDNKKGNFANYGNGVFGLGIDKKLHLIPYEDYIKNPISFTWALQNGPLLVQDGLNIRGTGTSKCNRSGIGFTKEGTVKIIYSDEPVTFRDFAELFIKNGCTDAIYLDGGSPAGCLDKTGKYGSLDKNAVKLQFFASS